MPYEDPDVEDPMELAGVEIESERENVLDMISCIAEEYARLGFGSQQILGLFRNAEYPPLNAALQQVGEPTVRQLVAEAVFIYGRRED